MKISGHTQVVAVIGDPVTHGRSPAMHNAAFEALGLDWVYIALRVPRGDGEGFVRACSRFGFAGLNVTTPHKHDAAKACDELHPDAQVLGAVNTIVAREYGSVYGMSTDGAGLLRSLASEAVDVEAKKVAVIGAGGAARSIVMSLGRAGADVTVAARDLEAATTAAELAPFGQPVELQSFNAGEYDIVIQATTVGMGGEASLVPAEQFREGQIAIDIIYSPAVTNFLAAAASRGARTINGQGMLVHQGALAFQAWTGQMPPIDVMMAAAFPS